jgi:predicted nucleic acid-binding protein
MLDTDVYSYVTSTDPRRGAPYTPHLQGQQIVLSFITVGEQYAGFRKRINSGEWKESQLQVLESRLAMVAVVPYDIDVCRTYAILKTTLKNPDGSHRVMAPNDLWIAACAVRHSLALVTHNRKHFTGVPGLRIISEAP